MMTTQFILSSIAAAAIAFVVDFKSWQSAGPHSLVYICLTIL